MSDRLKPSTHTVHLRKNKQILAAGFTAGYCDALKELAAPYSLTNVQYYYCTSAAEHKYIHVNQGGRSIHLNASEVAGTVLT